MRTQAIVTRLSAKGDIYPTPSFLLQTSPRITLQKSVRGDSRQIHAQRKEQGPWKDSSNSSRKKTV